MKTFFTSMLFHNPARKCVALLSAVLIWFLVNQSITLTRTFPDVAIRVINLPQDKTVVGLLPNGLLSKRTSVTITGTKSVISDLHSTDIEVVVNADGKKESWIAKIDKRTLSNLSSEWDLMKSITEVAGSDIFVKMSRLVVEEIPITVTTPFGDPPKGYQFLNVWPRQLTQRVSGPEEQVLALKKQGLELTFNLNKISESELESIRSASQCDEISYFMPNVWKQLAIPFRDSALEPLNDPRAKNLRIDFLKSELIPLGESLPLTVFYPMKYSRSLNPEWYSLATSTLVESRNGLHMLTIPLYARDVSRLFLDVVRENIELTIVAAPRNVQKKLAWTIEFINEKALEDEFVAISLEQGGEKYEEVGYSEELLRNRFRDYRHKLVLYTKEEKPLNLKAELQGNSINLRLDE
jgi:hypothetical protein